MNLNDINSATFSRLNSDMKNRVGWNFDPKKLSIQKASLMLEGVNDKMLAFKKSNRLFESQNNPAYIALVISKQVLESYIIEAMSRRDFMRGAAGALGAATIGSKSAKAAKPKKDPYGELDSVLDKPLYKATSPTSSNKSKKGDKLGKGDKLKEVSNKTKASYNKKAGKWLDDFEKAPAFGVHPKDEKKQPKRVEHYRKTKDVAEKADNPYAIGMAQAEKATGDKPPLKKSTINKAHKIAKAIKKEGKEETMRANELGLKKLKLKESNRLAQPKRRVIKEDTADAETIMAAQDMVDRIQGMLEDISEMLNEQLPPLTDTVRAAVDSNTAQNFSDTASSVLNTLLDAARDAREQMDGNVRMLKGEEQPGLPMTSPGMGDGGEMDMDMDLDEPALDFDVDDDFAASDAGAGADQALGRSKRA